MKRFGVIIYSISLFSLSKYGLSSHSYYVQMLINLSRSYDFYRLVIIAFLVSYAFIPQLRIAFTKFLLGTSGLGILSLGIASLISPNLFGHINNFLLIGDSLYLIEGGILAVVLSAELPYKKYHLRKTIFGSIYSNVYSLRNQMFASPIIASTLKSTKYDFDSLNMVTNKLSKRNFIFNKTPP